MSFTPERLRAALERGLRDAGAAPSGYCVALSGGLDSSVLLTALAASRPARGASLRAIHVDHGLHPDSPDWSARCRELAAGLGVPCEVLVVDGRPAAGESPEAAARTARYAALADLLQPGELLLTAHHADDQLETVLLQWLRGGGLRAVAGMRPVTSFAGGWLGRPLLEFTRADLEAWARLQGLDWVEDPANVDPRFDRNYLRLEVLPRLRQRWPAAAATVGRVADQAAEVLEMAAAVSAADLARLQEGETLSLERLAALPVARQRLVLRAWLASRGCPVPSAATLESLRHDMRVAGADRLPVTRWPGAVVRRYRGALYAEAGAAAGRWSPGRWRPGTTFDLGGDGRLELVAAVGEGLSRERLRGDLEVVPRPAGGTFRPAGHAHRRDLRKWLQERGVLPWRRATLPFVLSDGMLAAIGDLAYGHDLVAAAGEPSWRVVWRDRPALTEAEARAARACR